MAQINNLSHVTLPIYIYKNSSGGTLPEGLAFINYVKSFIKNDIIKIGDGILDSLATLIFVSIPGEKYLYRDCKVGVHTRPENMSDIYGSVIKNMYEENTKVLNKIDFLKEHYIFNAKEALDLGITDYIIDK